MVQLSSNWYHTGHGSRQPPDVRVYITWLAMVVNESWVGQFAMLTIKGNRTLRVHVHEHLIQSQYISSSREFSLVITDTYKHKNIPRTSVCSLVQSHLKHLYSRTSEQRTLWERVFCPLFRGCPYLGGSIV